MPGRQWCWAWTVPGSATDRHGAFHVWQILNDADIDPAPERASTTWADFLSSQAEALLTCGFLETVTLTGARLYVFAVIEHHTRRRVPPVAAAAGSSTRVPHSPAPTPCMEACAARDRPRIVLHGEPATHT
ncbi:hypothetical protein GCM10009527_075920 [Actinomadura nitritigenes]|uniref:Uncharacterized protein n=1 Tax=Actinomadura nitritigenes TaxID=134602 RepID=A0ABS3RFG9_9ACTN|nr:hypothetical protein [Actinomadura nitritigenes]MBO2444324.1 hypothetical protein [Actinomadura nitritigenes]